MGQVIDIRRIKFASYGRSDTARRADAIPPTTPAAEPGRQQEAAPQSSCTSAVGPFFRIEAIALRAEARLS